MIVIYALSEILWSYNPNSDFILVAWIGVDLKFKVWPFWSKIYYKVVSFEMVLEVTCCFIYSNGTYYWPLATAVDCIVLFPNETSLGFCLCIFARDVFFNVLLTWDYIYVKGTYYWPVATAVDYTVLFPNETSLGFY